MKNVHHFAITSPEFKIGDFVTNEKKKAIWRLTSLSNGHAPYLVYARACRKKKDGTYSKERFLTHGPYYKVVFPHDLLSGNQLALYNRLMTATVITHPFCTDLEGNIITDEAGRAMFRPEEEARMKQNMVDRSAGI